MLATAPKIDVYMDCQLILKQQVSFLLLHHKEEVALLAGLHWPLFGSFTVTCWRLLAYTVYGIHSPATVIHGALQKCVILFCSSSALECSVQCESSCTVNNQVSTFAG